MVLNESNTAIKGVSSQFTSWEEMFQLLCGIFDCDYAYFCFYHRYKKKFIEKIIHKPSLPEVILNPEAIGFDIYKTAPAEPFFLDPDKAKRVVNLNQNYSVMIAPSDGYLNIKGAIAIATEKKDIWTEKDLQNFGSVVKLLSTCDLLTENKQYQDTIMKSINTAIFSITNDGTMIHFNEAAEKIFGCRANWAIGRHYFETMAPKEREKMRSSFDYVMNTGNTYTGHFVEMTRLDNRVIYLNPLICPWFNREGEIIGAIGIMTDETENKRFQDHLIRAEKMAVLGQIAAQVSHELMNPLASIRGFARIIQKNEPAESKYYSYSKTIIEQVDRIKNVVRDLLDFGRPDEIRHESVDVNIAVQNAVKEIDVDIDRVKVLEQYEQDLPCIDGDLVKIERLFVNLIQNAYQSIQGSGVIEISTALTGDHVFITVKDSGCGIPRQYFNKIFDPYFTNKANGTGLGLAIVKQTVANYGGKIYVSSDIGIGTRFTVEFPIKKDKKYE